MLFKRKPPRRSAMEISGRLRSYQCDFTSAGWTYAHVVIQVTTEVSLFFGRLRVRRTKTLWQSGGKGSFAYLTAARAHPDELRQWYKKVVDEYEDYLIAWNKELGGSGSVSPIAMGKISG